MKLPAKVSVNSTMKRVGRAVEFLAWAVFFACAALVLALRLWLLPDIERYRGEIVAGVSRAVGQPVSIGAIQAGWSGLHPHVNLSDVRIRDLAGREVLALPKVELRLGSLVIDGLRVQVRRDVRGNLHIAGRQLGEGTAFSQWALEQDEVVLRNAEIEWLDELRGAPPLALSSLNLRLQNAGDQHAIGLTAQPPPELGSALDPATSSAAVSASGASEGSSPMRCSLRTKLSRSSSAAANTSAPLASASFRSRTSAS
jgi:uncharacterized protein YhdP